MTLFQCSVRVLPGKRQLEFQHTNAVLRRFTGTVKKAQRLYREYIKNGILQGKRPEPSRGGLVRSAGGWSAVKMLRKPGLYQKSDERILGDGDFVESVLHQANEVLFTGYYEPLLQGSRKPSAQYSVPIHGRPADLVEIDLSLFAPDLAGRRILGRYTNGSILPYPTRGEIRQMDDFNRLAPPVAWLKDEVDLLTLQVQGSGKVQFEDGDVQRIQFDSSNGRPYRSIGRRLIDRAASRRRICPCRRYAPTCSGVRTSWPIFWTITRVISFSKKPTAAPEDRWASP
jgi:hypothetical protein